MGSINVDFARVKMLDRVIQKYLLASRGLSTGYKEKKFSTIMKYSRITTIDNFFFTFLFLYLFLILINCFFFPLS